MRITKHSKHNFGRWITGAEELFVTLIAVKFVTPLFTIESNIKPVFYPSAGKEQVACVQPPLPSKKSGRGPAV